MAKVSQTCLSKMSQSQKNLNAWRLNWILGREFYRANKNEAFMLKWDAAAFLNVDYPMSYDTDELRIAFFKQVGNGLLANTPGWDDSACTLDMPSLACFCFWLAVIPEPMRLQAVGLLMQTDADLPYLSTICPNEVTNDPSYSVQEVPPVPGTETCKTSGSACASTSECCENMTCEQGKCAYSKGVEIDKLPPPGAKVPGTETIPGSTPGTATPVGAKEDATEKKVNWWLWGGIGAAVILGAAFIGAVRDPEYVVPPPAPNPAKKGYRKGPFDIQYRTPSRRSWTSWGESNSLKGAEKILNNMASYAAKLESEYPVDYTVKELARAEGEVRVLDSARHEIYQGPVPGPQPTGRKGKKS